MLSTMGLRLSPDETLITHIDEGLDFLGWRIQRHRKQGTSRHYVYARPAKKALRSVTAKIKTSADRSGCISRWMTCVTQVQPGDHRLVRLLPARRIVGKLRLPGPLHVDNGLALATTQTPPAHLEAPAPPVLPWRLVAIRRTHGTDQPGEIGTIRYRYRGELTPTLWPTTGSEHRQSRTGLLESPVH